MKRPDWRRVGNASREVALTVGAVLGTICLLFLVAGMVFHIKPLIVRSGSMEPTIATGALALSHTVPASDLAVGQIVSVKTLDGTRVTHRIVEIQPEGSKALLTLKGDANGSVDQQGYDVDEAERVVFDVPYAGYVVAWTSGRAGVFLGGLLAGGLVLLALRSPTRRPGAGKGNVLGAGAALVLVGTVLHGTTPARDTGAYFNDDAGFTGVTAASYTVPAPVIASCDPTPIGSTVARHVTLTWPGVTSTPTTYDVVVSTITASSITVSGTTTMTVDVAYDPGASSGNRSKIATVTVTPAVSGTPKWTGPPDTWKFQTASNNNQPTCGEKVAPTPVVITAPNTTTRAFALKATDVSTACGANVACGSMNDSSSISTVEYTFSQTIGGTTKCWSGSAWVAGPCGFLTGTVASQTTWRVPGVAAAAYNAAGAYSLTVRVTDIWGNATTTPPQVFTLT